VIAELTTRATHSSAILVGLHAGVSA
jgi:hypothetical protein